MKQVLFLFFMLCISSNIPVKGQTDTSSQEIILKVYTDDDREIKDRQPDMPSVPKTRSVVVQPAYAYLYNYNKVISINFTEIFSTATVTVTNENTGEIVYSETSSSPVSLNIDLNSKPTGSYLIEIETDDIYMEGKFSI